MAKPTFIKLKEPGDIILYVQRLVNRLRRQDLEIDPVYIGKIVYLMNTWLSAYKIQMEAIELKELKTQIDEIKSRLEAIK
ncbi:MAG: hypothetical protein WCJ37_13460 [Syntrophus sp. (in: bacteria)]